MAELHYFGKIREILGQASETLILPSHVSTAEDLRQWLVTRYGDAGACLLAPTVRIIVNEQITDWEATVSDADQLAFIPPVSGG